MRSPCSRSVGGRPTLRCRSEALRWISCWRTALKLNICPGAEGAGATGGAAGGTELAIGIDPEERLPVLDGLRVGGENLGHDSRDLGLDLVHDLHRLDDAEYLPFRDARTHRDVRLGARLGRGIEGPYHGRLDVVAAVLRLSCGRRLHCRGSFGRRGMGA